MLSSDKGWRYGWQMLLCAVVGLGHVALAKHLNHQFFVVLQFLERITRYLEEDLLYWHKEKGQKLVTAFGLQLPSVMQLKSDLAQNIRTNEDLSQYISQSKPILAQEKTYLAVPYAEKDNARILGAKWDKEAKSWYAPEDADMNKLKQWLPKEIVTISQSHQNPIDEFAVALKKAGLVVQNIKADGQLHLLLLKMPNANKNDKNASK